MASSTIDLEQWKLLQNFALPTSRPAITSLYDKEAHLAHGRSKNTAIYIPSDVESDTDDEGDASQLDSSQSYETRTSTPDYLDLTTTENGVTESEAAIVGTDTMSVVHSTQAKAATAGPNEPKVAHLVDTEPSKQSSSPAADGKQLRPDPPSQQNNVVVDSVSEYGDCHSSQVHQGFPSIGSHYLQTRSPIKESEIPADNASDNSIPETSTQSIAGPCHDLHQGQGSDDVIDPSIRSESEAIEPEPNFEAGVPSTMPSLRHSRHNSLQILKGHQSEVTGAGNDAYSDSEDKDSDDANGARKRRRVSKSPSYSVPSNTTRSGSFCKSPSATDVTQSPNDIQPSGHEMHTSIPSQATVPRSDASALLARFEEWPLENVLLKRITEGIKMTFQVQFELSAFSYQLHTNEPVSHLKKRKRLARNLRLIAKSSGEAWTPENNHISSISDTIFVAGDGEGSDSDDNDLGTKSNFEDDSYSDSEPGTTRTFQRRKTQRRRWRPQEDKHLRRLKYKQEKNGNLLDSRIAAILGRIESAVKQH
ncbi:hypothetical protein F53441_4984 [Fusarium austroafricanum]|uniref:Uncharacterized protein n=1 Tax=Fusarium austroafricanum TaxID=2364996 RepID=A0A8H4KM29_9HYPO|nr:hypothetical protein F53441_4984 [Fusarium austroafricanum]